ncbi:MAG TPA: hypothetical protein VHY20_00510, partial [Pirellulales bacterium]|nr:hypothetical protein [Pirellulales bacterium]
MKTVRFFQTLSVLAVAIAGLVVGSSARAEDWAAALRQKQLLLMCSGKGSSVAYDAGVVKCAFENLPALQQQRVIMAGNSSGSILATYFSNVGFSKTSVDYMAYRLQHADVSAIRSNESGSNKALKLARNQPTEISPENLREYIAFALNVPDWKGRSIAQIVASSHARPNYPYLVVAANMEVLDNRRQGSNLSGLNYKVFDPLDYSVSWKPDVYEFYKSHPEQF